MPSPSSPLEHNLHHDLHGHWPQVGSADDIAHNLAQVNARIRAACQRCGRDPATVRLLPVSKTRPASVLRLAYQAGCRMLGENKVREALQKSQVMQDLADLKWSVIGHLQTNKAKLVAQFAHEFQALDSLRVADALNRHLEAAGRTLDVLVQINTSNEASKYGLAPLDAAAFIHALPQYPRLRVRGLMTLAVFSGDAQQVRQCFVALRTLRDHLRSQAPPGVALDELSMGMSGDFELAIEEGATIVRVGQALFGARIAETP